MKFLQIGRFLARRRACFLHATHDPPTARPPPRATAGAGARASLPGAAERPRRGSGADGRRPAAGLTPGLAYDARMARLNYSRLSDRLLAGAMPHSAEHVATLQGRGRAARDQPVRGARVLGRRAGGGAERLRQGPHPRAAPAGQDGATHPAGGDRCRGGERSIRRCVRALQRWPRAIGDSRYGDLGARAAVVDRSGHGAGQGRAGRCSARCHGRWRDFRPGRRTSPDPVDAVPS